MPLEVGKKSIVFVTGGAGYVGSHACKALAAAGYQPVVYDNLSRGHASAVKWGPLIKGDILDRTALIAALRQTAPVAVIHFAAYAYVGESMASPDMYYRNNVAGTLQLLEAMNEARCKRLVFSSSCAVYGGVHNHPIDEATPCEPASTYGHTKLICEQMIRDYVRAYGFAGIALRYFNAAGSDPDGEIGENHDPEPHIIPSVLRVAAGIEPTITINGTDHPTPDGTCVRDFVHVSDLARAHVQALDLILTQASGMEVVNLGAGLGVSLKQIIDAAQRITKQTISVNYGGRRAGDPPYAVGRAERAQALLNWQPQYRELDVLMAHTWQWMNVMRQQAA